MSFALDHLFIFTAVGAPEGERLLGCGLTEGERNIHPGQGTANQRFFFRNAVLECLWVHDPHEARCGVIDRMRLRERWHDRVIGASPSGIARRPLHPTEQEIPFPAWEYRPRYLPPILPIYVATNSTSSRSPCSSTCRLDGGLVTPTDRRQPLEHAIGVREITAHRITLPHRQPWSAAVQAVERLGVAERLLSLRQPRLALTCRAHNSHAISRICKAGLVGSGLRRPVSRNPACRYSATAAGLCAGAHSRKRLSWRARAQAITACNKARPTPCRR
jgi:hypothetical protein